MQDARCKNFLTPFVVGRKDGKARMEDGKVGGDNPPILPFRRIED
jgi:hypothetical protein